MPTQTYISLRDNPDDPSGLINHRHAPDLMLFHGRNGTGDIVIIATNHNRVRHHISDPGVIRITRLGDYLDRQIPIRDDSDQFHRSFIVNHWQWSQMLTPHNARGLANQIIRQTADRILCHDFAAFHILSFSPAGGSVSAFLVKGKRVAVALNIKSPTSRPAKEGRRTMTRGVLFEPGVTTNAIDADSILGSEFESVRWRTKTIGATEPSQFENILPD